MKLDLYILNLSVRTTESHFVGRYADCVHRAIDLFEQDVLTQEQAIFGDVPMSFVAPYPYEGDVDDKMCWIQTEYVKVDTEAIIEIHPADNELVGEVEIGDVVSPFEIRETYERMFSNTLEKRNLANRVADLKRQMELRIAQAVSEGAINGPNEDTRKAQRAMVTKDLQEQVNDIQGKQDQLDADLAADSVLCSMYNTIINWFNAMGGHK